MRKIEFKGVCGFHFVVKLAG